MKQNYTSSSGKGWVSMAASIALLLSGHLATAQEGGQGNTTIFSGGQMTFFGDYNFGTGGSGAQPGIIGTERAPAVYGILNFAATANNHTGAGDAAHVDGYVRKLGTTSFIFPVGDNGQYGPFAAAGDGTTGAYFHVDPTSAITSNLGGGNYPVLPASGPFPATSMGAGVNAVSTVEYWDIDGTNTTPITLTWDLGSNVATLTGSTLPLLTILGWNGTSWVAIPSVVDATSVLGGTSDLSAGSITTTGSIVPNTYTVYTLGALVTPLPVTLLSFTATKSQHTVLLNWETSVELNSDRFDIEHSTTGKNWAPIGKVKSKGTSTQKVSYTFIHETPKTGTNFYRLKMIDRDGSSAYSTVRSLYFDGSNTTALYPNPASDVVYIGNKDLSTISSISLVAMDGRQLLFIDAVKDSSISLKGIATGNYILKISYQDGTVENHKIVKK
jgi:hypothetical protein